MSTQSRTHSEQSKMEHKYKQTVEHKNEPTIPMDRTDVLSIPHDSIDIPFIQSSPQYERKLYEQQLLAQNKRNQPMLKQRNVKIGNM
jgi:hypothetical protein